MTRMTALVLSVLLVTLLGGGGWIYWRLHLNASGYCENTKTYNDKDTIIRLAVENELKNMVAQGIGLEGRTLEQAKEGDVVVKTITSPAYSNLDEFFLHNPNCCHLDPNDPETGPIHISLSDQIAGYSHGLIITWASPYLEEDRQKIFTYRGDRLSETLKYFNPTIGSYRSSVLKVSNCGRTDEAFMRENPRRGGRL